jgi:hypothetical protein
MEGVIIVSLDSSVKLPMALEFMDVCVDQLERLIRQVEGIHDGNQLYVMHAVDQNSIKPRDIVFRTCDGAVSLFSAFCHFVLRYVGNAYQCTANHSSPSQRIQPARLRRSMSPRTLSGFSATPAAFDAASKTFDRGMPSGWAVNPATM